MNYVLVDRRHGCAVWDDTISRTKREVWFKAYPGVAQELKWGAKYWKRLKPSQRAARKAGFKIQKCDIQLL